MQFAKAVVGVSYPNIGNKGCKTKDGNTGKNGNDRGQYAESTNTSTDHSVALCGGAGRHSSGGSTSPQYLKDFVEKTLKEDGNGNWPTSTVKKSGGREPATDTNDNAKNVATDLVALNPDEKTTVAGLLAKTIEGGEVVEICVSPCRAWLAQE
ncbi:hypothetical protein ANAPC1_01321 [Anaplasma phagocytophilum]|uniref:Uncharacterized protein n=1 Tax=Anaplasma phagocytophilum TaxID=948 RepID=A0AA45UU51_ANAPH|nr:hypothetical protein [Anaplasma phagocytophilum]SBO14944.1 hypothetical protein ANAPC1_01321 [Anaplasma phagocytophilum]